MSIFSLLLIYIITISQMEYENSKKIFTLLLVLLTILPVYNSRMSILMSTSIILITLFIIFTITLIIENNKSGDFGD